MGVDFIRKTAPSFKKSWAQHRQELETPDLFTAEPDCITNTAPADICDLARLSEGDTVTVQLIDDSRLVALRGLDEVASFNNPPEGLISAVRLAYSRD